MGLILDFFHRSYAYSNSRKEGWQKVLTTYWFNKYLEFG
jgi:hypothetical protein